MHLAIHSCLKAVSGKGEKSIPKVAYSGHGKINYSANLPGRNTHPGRIQRISPGQMAAYSALADYYSAQADFYSAQAD